jgi:E3 ubiquitin-protein ligase HUWE1
MDEYAVLLTNAPDSDMRNFNHMRPHRADRPGGNEDGLNPLLRRSNDAGRDASPRAHPSNLVRLLGGSLAVGESPLSVINELITSLPSIGRHGPLQLHITQQGPRGEVEELSVPFPHHIRETFSESRRDTYQDPALAASFSAEATMSRWIEETKMVFGIGHQEKSHKLLQAILAHLVPPAIQRDKELKAKEAEQRRKLEEERKKRDEEDRKAREAREAEEHAAREKAEAEERERAEAAAAELAAQVGTASVDEAEESDDEDHEETEAMEGIETASEPPAAEEPAADQPRVLTTIRGEQVDVTELGIDPDYLEALPEEFREEVIAQTISQRRSQAREAPRRTGEQTEVFQEFLDALPDELRQEIVQQERAEQRRREREETRRQNAAAGHEVVAQDMDPASILLTFPDDLRRQVLMDQGADLMDSLPPEMAAEARDLVRNHPAVVHRARDQLVAAGRVPDPGQPSAIGETVIKPQRKTVVQMLDKSGVATLLRLMFINVKGGSLEHSLKHVIKDVCENKQTRLEVVSTLLQILQDGTTDVEAVERSFAQLSIKAKQPKERDGKTPQSLKRTLTNISASNQVHTSSETSPVLIVQQCLDLLSFLAEEDVHVPGLFLTEHDTVGSTLKRSLSRKGKGKGPDTKTHKYAINSLLAMLDRDLVTESSAIMDSLSQLLGRVTMPLLALDRKLKEAAETIKKLDKQIEEGEAAAAATKASSEEPTSSNAQSTETSKAPASDEAPAAASTTGDASATTAEATASTNADALVKAKERREFIQKRVKTYNPPQIPVHNLTMIINIFVARECSSKTFKETLSTIKNLSVIPGAMNRFGQELARQARLLSEKIVVHLDELLPHIEKASTGTEIQGVALAKFSPGAADQNKLLRVLTALDHLFSQKKTESAEDSEPSNETKKQDLLATLYRNPTFNALWERLSACLGAIRQRESLINVATILLPLIEALMVVCKDTAVSEVAQSQGSKDMVLSSPPPESAMTNLFLTFTEDHRRILNELVRNNPSLMKGTFAHLVKNPKVLEFDNKRSYFTRSVHNRNQIRDGRSFPTLQLSVRRDQVFHDSFKSLYFKSGDEMKFGKLNIRFHGEEGVDAGGVTREWFQVLSRQMFDPNYVLFVPVSSDRTTFHPNKLSGINDEHLMFFKFIGRVIGKALYEGRVLDCYFSRAVYKRILGKPVSVKDMESFDPDYYKSLVWMLENDITDIITESFSVETDEFGVTKIEDLVENGRDIPVTDENKQDYVRLVVEHKLLKSVKDQMEHFLKGKQSLLCFCFVLNSRLT